MKRSFLIICFLFLYFSSTLIAQVTYDPGYYINNNGDTIKGFIRNLDWKNNPEFIKFKAQLSDDPSVISVNEMIEFAVDDNMPLRRYTVLWDENINRSDEFFTYFKEPHLISKTILLRQLNNSGVKLYEYTNNFQNCFYISKSDSTPELLIFKYYLQNKVELRPNNQYQAQLYLLLQCSCLGMLDFESLEYSAKSISDRIKQYNNCQGIDEKDEKRKQNTQRKTFEFGISTGMQLSRLKVVKYLYFGIFDTVNFPLKVLPVAGFDAEYYLPFYRNKISIGIRPEISYFSSTETVHLKKTNLSILLLNIPIQATYSWYLKNETRIFASFGFGITIPVYHNFSGAFVTYKPHNVLYFVGGIGAQIGKRFKVTLQQSAPHDLFIHYTHNDASISQTTLGFTYKL